MRILLKKGSPSRWGLTLAPRSRSLLSFGRQREYADGLLWIGYRLSEASTSAMNRSFRADKRCDQEILVRQEGEEAMT